MKFEWLQSKTEKFTLIIKYITAFIFIFPLSNPYLINKRWNMFDIPVKNLKEVETIISLIENQKWEEIETIVSLKKNS